jgi:L,D-peptidoglycan transpeptidase YkuD (ErfK/YbiS/YcfS/YnhG family)
MRSETMPKLDIKSGTRLARVLVAVLALACASTCGNACPELLRDARRLILITAPTMDAIVATAHLFERDAPEAPWRSIHPAEPVVLGRFGMAWGPDSRDLARDQESLKAEGDKRTPAGIYRTGIAFGFAPSQGPNYLQIKAGDTVCVNDPSSPAYNTITSRAMIGTHTRAEDMANVELYRRGLAIDYPTKQAAAAGSCIFIHVWRTRDKGTDGCIAMPESRVAALQDFAERGAIVAILPESSLINFKGCLPDVPQTSKSGAPE